MTEPNLHTPQPLPPTVALRPALAAAGVTLYPVLSLGALAVIDGFQSNAFTALAPDVAKDLGVSAGSLISITGFQVAGLGLAPLAIVALIKGRPVRAVVALGTGVAWSTVTLLTGMVTELWMLALIVMINGLATASVMALHIPLLVDTYPRTVRARVLSLYGLSGPVGAVLPALLVSLLSGWLGLSWREVFAALGVGSLAVCLLALRLRDPGSRGGAGSEEEGGLTAISRGFVRATLRVPTVRRVMAGSVIFGCGAVPLSVFLSVFLEQNWRLDAGQRALFFAGVSVTAIFLLLAGSRHLEMLFQRSPVKVMAGTGLTLSLGIVTIVLGGLATRLWMVVALFTLGAALLSVFVVGIGLCLMSVLPSPLRAHGAALLSTASGVGGMLGAVLLGGLAASTALIPYLLVPGLLGAGLITSAARTISTDMERVTS